MKIAYLHYHLNTGGVTTVLRQQIEAVRAECDILTLTGQPPEGDFPSQIAHIPQLAYRSVHPQPVEPSEAARAVREAVHTHFGGPCDVLHVHNPILAKNDHLLKTLRHLQDCGFRLFVQIHDFAEDGRPQAYSADPYPADCHYGVINKRDYAILLDTGLEPAGLHLIPNVVQRKPSATRGHVRLEPPLALYPVRAIRRKNAGEAILLSLFFENGIQLGFTLPPNSPADRRSYLDWKRFVRDRQLPVHFEMSLRQDFFTLMACARFLITTSVTEGFGFSFLEPWLYDNLIWGRKLADICHDFEENGIRLDHLYERLRVPLGWIDRNAFHDRWLKCVRLNARTFGCRLEERSLEAAFSKITADRCIDFALLDEIRQREIIAGLISRPRRRHGLLDLNPFLEHPGRIEARDELIRGNKLAVMEKYPVAQYGERLLGVYRSVRSRAVRHRIDKHLLLKAFFDPERFSLLKWGAYDG